LNRNSTFVVLGSTGTIGTEISMILEANGHEVVRTNRATFNHHSFSDFQSFISDFDDIILVNCIGVLPDQAENFPESSFEANFQILRNVSEAAMVHANCRLIQLSTSLVFQGDKNSPYVETDSTSPLSIYGYHKNQAEEFLLNMNSFSNTIYRMGSIVSKSLSKNTTLNFLTKQILNNEPLRIVAGRRISLCSTQMLVESMIEEDFKTSIRHITHDGVTSWEEVTNYILQKLQINLSTHLISHQDLNPEKLKAPRPINSSLSTIFPTTLKSIHWRQLIDIFISDIGIQGV
jgi:dTDP-4-dehydrorhamnose reductase